MFMRINTAAALIGSVCFLRATISHASPNLRNERGRDLVPTTTSKAVSAPYYDPDSFVSWGDMKIYWLGDQCVYFTLYYTGGCSLAQSSPWERYPLFSNVPKCIRQWDNRVRIMEIHSGFPGVYNPMGVWTYQMAPASEFAAKYLSFHVPSIALANIWSDGSVDIQMLRNIDPASIYAPGCTVDDDWIRCPTGSNVTLATYLSNCKREDGIVCCGCAKIPDGRHYPAVPGWSSLVPSVKLLGMCAERDNGHTCSHIYNDTCVQTWNG